MKDETRFRVNVVDKFLKTLKNSFFFSVQQVSINGTPDKLGVCAGRMVALELKSLTGKLSKIQEWHLEQIRKCGGVALEVSPRNWEEVKQILARLDAGKKEEIE